ncbi:MAG: biotin carboxylase [bacterium P3]|nr:MAG: biotin carboxylase [bacterium P3]KWW42518.1 MAG: biotin carboxylase [bacterium F083]
MDLTGKKLLILGGGATSIDIVEAARALGVYTIVTDWYDTKRSPAKLIADEYWNEEIFKPELIAQLIKEHHVDGVITGFTDSYLLQYHRICELSGLPCYATKEVFETTMDKAKFKQLCRDYDVPVIPEYDLASFDPNTISENHKIIIKPVDNSGSRGVILCEKSEDFQHCLEFALSFSEKKQVVIEKYMEMDSISASYTIQDGVVSLSTLNDRYVHKAKGAAAVTCAGIYPSRYYDSYMEKMDGKMKNMYQKAGLKNGVVAVQFFTDGEEYYVMEMGHRLSGGQHYTYTKQENGISALDSLIHFAITGKMADFSIAEKDNANFKHTYCHLFILGKQAKIARFEGLEYLKSLPELIHFSQMKMVGDTIGADGTSAQKVVGLHLKVDNMSHLEKVLNEVRANFRIYDEQGNNLVIELMK